jgi:carbonic anhydrase
MAHHCDAALVTCEDFRLHQRSDGSNCMVEFIQHQGTDCDVITRAGGIQDLVRPKPGHDESLLRDLAVSAGLHRVRRFLLVQHQDCGAYKPLGLTSPEAEIHRHTEDLQAAQSILKAGFPGIEILLFVARLKPGSAEKYIVEPVQ